MVLQGLLDFPQMDQRHLVSPQDQIELGEAEVLHDGTLDRILEVVLHDRIEQTERVLDDFDRLGVRLLAKVALDAPDATVEDAGVQAGYR